MPAVIAHRGASSTHRENTVAAFREAARVGADAVELDARRTADGQVAVHHDAVLADGRALCDTPSTDLPDGVSRLAEALDACDGMWVNVEIKNSPSDLDHDPQARIVDLVIEELGARDEPERWLLSSFDAPTLDRCRALAPALRSAWIVGDIDESVVGRCVDAGHVAVHPWVGRLTAAGIDRCHERGLLVNTWTCNETGRMGELLDAGADGICTDVPDVLVALLAGRQRR